MVNVAIVLWSEAIFSLKGRSGQGQVTKDQISKLTNITKNGYLDSFFLRNPMVPFVFTYNLKKSQKSHLKNKIRRQKSVGNSLERKKNSSLGVKNWAIDSNFWTLIATMEVYNICYIFNGENLSFYRHFKNRFKTKKWQHPKSRFCRADNSTYIYTAFRLLFQ